MKSVFEQARERGLHPKTMLAIDAFDKAIAKNPTDALAYKNLGRHYHEPLTMNTDLKNLFDADRKDHAVPRIAGTQDYDDLRIRDRERRKQVQSILRDQNVTDSVDLYRAAWILNHGDQATEAEEACRLAEKSLSAGYEPAKWLYAAAFDRYCMYRGQPQRFGTQIVPDGKRYRLWDTDPGTTDEDRKRYNVPSLAKMHQRAAQDSLTMEQPPMEFAPDWLVDAVSRWKEDADD